MPTAFQQPLFVLHHWKINTEHRPTYIVVSSFSCNFCCTVVHAIAFLLFLPCCVITFVVVLLCTVRRQRSFVLLLKFLFSSKKVMFGHRHMFPLLTFVTLISNFPPSLAPWLLMSRCQNCAFKLLPQISCYCNCAIVAITFQMKIHDYYWNCFRVG